MKTSRLNEGHGLAGGNLARLTLLLPLVCLTVGADDSLSARRQRVDALSIQEKEDLLRKKDRFENLTPAERERIRELHRQIATHDKSAKLQEVMQRYGEWLKTLTAFHRADLSDLPLDERIQKIREIKRRYDEERFRRSTRLAREDARQVLDWVDELATLNEQKWRERLDDKEKRRFDRIPSERGRRAMVLRHMYSRYGDQEFAELPSQQIESLLRRLSKDAQDNYHSKQTPEDRNRLIAEWIRAAVFSQWMPRKPPSDEELLRFVKELPADERDRLEQLPQDRLRRELARRYFEQKRFGRDGRFGGRMRRGRPRPRPDENGPATHDRGRGQRERERPDG